MLKTKDQRIVFYSTHISSDAASASLLRHHFGGTHRQRTTDRERERGEKRRETPRRAVGMACATCTRRHFVKLLSDFQRFLDSSPVEQ